MERVSVEVIVQPADSASGRKETYRMDLYSFTKIQDAKVGYLAFEDSDGTWRFPAVLFPNGELITYYDWQALNITEETVLKEIADPTWAHHWIHNPTGGQCVIIDGLPRWAGL